MGSSSVCLPQSSTSLPLHYRNSRRLQKAQASRAARPLHTIWRSRGMHLQDDNLNHLPVYTHKEERNCRTRLLYRSEAEKTQLCWNFSSKNWYFHKPIKVNPLASQLRWPHAFGGIQMARRLWGPRPSKDSSSVFPTASFLPNSLMEFTEIRVLKKVILTERKNIYRTNPRVFISESNPQVPPYWSLLRVKYWST